MNYHVDLAVRVKKHWMFEPGKYVLYLWILVYQGSRRCCCQIDEKMEQGTSHKVPIIALTAHTTDDINKTFLNAGINNVLSKPLSREQAKEIFLGNGI